MALSTDLVSQFVKVTRDNANKKTETTLYGKAVIKAGGTYVIIDGADETDPTPCATTVDVSEGDRVTLTVKNHSAIITGNITNPSTTPSGATISNMTNRLNGCISYIGYDEKELDTDYVTVNKRLSAAKAEIDDLSADHADFKDATVKRLEVAEAAIDNLSVENGVIENLDAKYAKIERLEAVEAVINTLDSTYATITELESVQADIKTLNTEVATIDDVIFGTATGMTVQTNFSNAVIAQVGNAQIKSAMIESVSADKITSGSIVTNIVTIKSNDGKMIISDETMQISDGTHVRVQIGKDDSGDYSISVWDQNGNRMFYEGGITENAIKDAIIRDDMVSETADISASKLNIDSLFSEINGSTNTIKSTKVYLDENGDTLDVVFKELSTTVTEHGTTITSQGSDITYCVDSIDSKIWQEDIDTAIATVQVGGRNLLLDSSEGYLANLSEYSGTTSVDETEYKITTLASGESNGFCWVADKYSVDLSEIVEDTGEYYSFSLDVRLTGSFTNFKTWLDIRSASDNRDRPLNIRIIPESIEYDKWVRISGTAAIGESTLDDHTKSVFAFAWDDSEIGSTIEWRRLKLERGNTPSDWTPAPEDTDSNIATLTTQYSALEQTVDSISATVASHSTTLESKADNTTVTSVSEQVVTLEQTLDGFQTTVSDTYATKTALTTTDAKADAAQEDIDNLEIGARNYFVRKNINNFAWGSASDEHPYGVMMANTIYRGFSFQANEGESWTVYRTDTTNNRWGLYWLAEEPVAGADFLSGGSFRRDAQEANIVNYVTVPTGATWGFIYLSNDISTGEIPNIMLEKGNRATDWTPAPEDVDSDISDALDAANNAQADVDALEIRVTAAETSITQNAEAIELRATKTEVSTAKSEAISSAVATASSDATAKADAALASANQNTADLLEDYSTTSEMEAAIQLSADSITSSVSSTYATKTALDELEIGGRNYFRPSQTVDLGCSGGSGAGSLLSTGKCVGFYISVVAGETWSLSRSSTDTPNRFDYGFTIDEPASGVTIYEWSQAYRSKTKIEGITIPDGYNYLFLYLSNQSDDVSDIKLERGDKCTDWTPAPEDVDADISALDTRVTSAESSITQLSNKITANVTETTNLGTRTTTLEQTASGLTTRLDSQTIGGTNILRGTNTVSSLGTSSSWASSTWRSAGGGTGERTVIDISDAPNPDIKKGFQIVGDDTDTTTAQDNVPVTEGTTYTMSCYAKGTGSMRLQVGKSPYSAVVHVLEDVATWTKYSFAFVAGDGNGITDGNTNVYFGNRGTGTLQMCGFKMEVGNTATDWTPSPYDVDLGISDASRSATDYLSFSDAGLIIGDMTVDSLGKNVLIDSDSVDIREGDTTLASFGADYLYLAKNSRNAKIDLCNGLATLYHESKYSYDTLFVIDTGNATELMGLITPLCVTSTDDSEKVAIQFANADGVRGGIGIVGTWLRRFGSNMYDAYTLLDSGNFYDVMDSGWISGGVIGENFTLYSDSDQIQYRKIGKTVEIRGAVKPTSVLAGSGDAYTIFTLPEGYRPSKNIYERCQGSGAFSWLLSITTSGVVRFARYNDGADYVDTSTSSWLPFHAVFFVD